MTESDSAHSLKQLRDSYAYLMDRAYESSHAIEVADADLTDDEEMEDDPCEEDISRWRTLFRYTRREALLAIRMHRADSDRGRLSDREWEAKGPIITGLGHDRESFEYSFVRRTAWQAKSPADGKFEEYDAPDDTRSLGAAVAMSGLTQAWIAEHRAEVAAESAIKKGEDDEVMSEVEGEGRNAESGSGSESGERDIGSGEENSEDDFEDKMEV